MMQRCLCYKTFPKARFVCFIGVLHAFLAFPKQLLDQKAQQPACSVALSLARLSSLKSPAGLRRSAAS